MHRRLRTLRTLEALVLGTEQRARAAAAAVEDWPLLFQRARHHAVAGAVGLRLSALQIAPPSDVARAFARRDAEDELWFVHLAQTLADVTRGLSSIGADYVALKGPALAVRVADPPHTRRSTDLDLLVDRRHLDGAAAVLAKLGYSRLTGPALRDHAATHFAHPTWPGVELHHAAHVGFGEELPADALLRGASVVDVMGARVRVPAPAVEIAYLAVHAAGHRFERLSWLLDIARLVTLRRADPSEVAVAADALRGRHALALTLSEIERARGHAGQRSARARLVLVAEERPVGSHVKALLNALSSALLADDASLAASFVATKLRRDLVPRLRSIW